MSQMQAVIKRENEEFESKLSFTKGESLLLLCQKAGIFIETPCNKKGICGRCRVRFVKGAPFPQPAERRSLSPEELRRGVRLACAARLTEDCEIVLPQGKGPDAVGAKREVSWERQQKLQNMQDRRKQGDVLDDRREADCSGDGGYFIAADIGTTTVVMELRQKSDGRVAGIYKGVNAQRSYGADVLSRMEAALDGNGEELARLIREQLAEGVKQLTESANRLTEGAGQAVDFMVIAANTTMVHLLMGYDVTGLSRAPFVPETLSEIITEIGGLKTYVMPGISAFVGGDIAAGLYWTAWEENRENEETREGKAVRKSEESGKSADIRGGRNTLFIDLGTNAELVLYGEKEGICCATAAGPAFDGDAGTGFFGSDMIAVLAKLLHDRIVDETGALDDAHFEDGVDVSVKNGRMHVSQQQIRNLQLAKAAVRGGIEVLLKKKNLHADQISRVYLAGGFGYYLDVRAAVRIGLLPEELEQKTVSCGNTALSGAAVYGYLILTGKERTLPLSLQAINLAEEALFTDSYVNYINLDSNRFQDPGKSSPSLCD